MRNRLARLSRAAVKELQTKPSAPYNEMTDNIPFTSYSHARHVIAPHLRGADAVRGLQWSWPIFAGLIVLYLPTYVDLARVFWIREAGSHAPLVLLVVAWLLWTGRAHFMATDGDVRPRLGGALLAFGLICYIIGRSQTLYVMEAFSQIPVLAGTLLLVKGMRTVRAVWFPIAFLVFVIPLPGSLLDPILLPLKQLVSGWVDALLYAAGYPISRSGVVLQVGQYQLLIANACSGLHSLIGLSAVGVLSVYLMRRTHPMHNVLLLASIIPIAILANVLRVTTLVLGTYHFGSDTGEHLHDIMGYLEILFAFAAFMLADTILTRVFRERRI